MKIFINEVEKTSYLVDRSIKINDTVNARNTCSFLMRATIDHLPVSGQELKVKNQNEELIFAGIIANVKAADLEIPILLDISVDASGYSRYAERRTLANVYENVNQSDIVKAIIATKLSVFGVTEGEIQDGATINRISYNYMKCSAVLDELANMNGRIWWIDYEKKLHFVAKETFIAPFAISDTNRKYISMDKEKDDGAYRNTQIIRAGKGTTDLQTESFVGDGTRQTFNVAFPIQSIASITVNGVEKTFGINQQDQGKDYYYNVDKTEVTQAKDAIPLTTFYTLIVNYYGYYPIVVLVGDDDEIESRATIEGTSGIYESVDDDPTIDSLVSALAKADGLMKENGKVQSVISYSTYENGLKAGMLQHIEIADLGINDDFLITSVKASEHAQGMVKYDISAIDGYDTGGWASFFKKLTGVNANYTIRGSELFVILNRNIDNIYMSDELLAEIVSNLHYVGTGIVGVSDVYTEEEYGEIYG